MAITPADPTAEETSQTDVGNEQIPTATQSPPPVTFRDLSPAIEFCCWTVVALAPFLRWVNGAAVTDDQFVLQLALVALALAGAVGLRLYNWRMAQGDADSRPSAQSQRE